MMNHTELKAEAAYQMKLARGSGIADATPTEDHGMIIRFNNGTVTMNDGRTVIFELNGRIMTYHED